MPATALSSVACTGDTPAIFNPAGQTGNPVIGDPVRITRIVSPLQLTATATQDLAVPLPLGARVTDITSYQNVAPTGATVTVSAGSTVGGADVFAASDVKTSAQSRLTAAVNGIRPLVVANFASVVASQAGGSVLNLRVTQTTPTAVGNLTFIISYIMV